MSPLERAVAEFAAAYRERLLDPYGAHDLCVQASEEFARCLARHGADGEVINGVRMAEFMGHRVLAAGHFAVRVGDEVYDWTYRQFDPSCAVPRVTGLAQWRAEWPELAADAHD